MNYRVNKRDRFTQIENDVLRDENLSMEGLALLVRLLSRSDNWRSNINELVKNGKGGDWTEGAIKRGFKNLSKNGYAKLVKVYNIESKVMAGSYYEIFEDKEQGKLFPNTIYVNSNNDEVEKQSVAKQRGQVSDTSGTQAYIYIEPTNKENINNISSDEEPNNTSDLVSVNCTQQNIDANCTLPIVDSTKPIYKVKKKETQPKDELKSKFRKDFEELWNKAGKEKMTNIGYIAINRLYEKYGYDKACFIRDYVIELYGSNERSIAYNKNHENALAFYKDPNDEQPRYLNDSWKTMQRFSRPNAEEPVVFDFPMEDALYAAWEWYFSGKGFEGSELVKKVREKIKEINHSRFNKY